MRTTLIRLATLLVAGIVLGTGFSVASAVASHQFSDVPNSNVHHADIGWLVDHEIAEGYPNGTFRPNDPVLRRQAAKWFHAYNSRLHVVFHSQSYTGATEVNNAATCPAGERALAGGGNTDSFNMMLTDITPSGDHVSVRWETDNNATANGNSNAWALCGPGL